MAYLEARNDKGRSVPTAPRCCSVLRLASDLIHSDHGISMHLRPALNSDGASAARNAHGTSSAIRACFPSVADMRGNKIGCETVEEVDDTERQASMNAETLRARFETQMLPLMNEAFNLARWLMKNHQDAEDVVQEAYLRAFRYFKGFYGGSGKAWLLKIVRNVCLDHFSKRTAEDNFVIVDDSCLEIEDVAPAPSVILEKKVAIEAVRAAIEALPVDFRDVIVLREMDGLSYKEIAEVTGAPIGTVMSRLARARQHLSTVLAEKKKLDQL
jgi:RNA polymerase sigma factor (sigma-70 family)